MTNRKTVFIAHPIEFFSKTLKEFAKLKDLEVYILDEYDDFNYLVRDLDPKMIIVHEDILDEYESSVRSALSENNALLAIIGTEQNSSSKYFFVSPLDPNQLIEEILDILEKNS